MLIIKGVCLKCNNDTQVIEFLPYQQVSLPTKNPQTMPGLCQIWWRCSLLLSLTRLLIVILMLDSEFKSELQA